MARSSLSLLDRFFFKKSKDDQQENPPTDIMYAHCRTSETVQQYSTASMPRADVSASMNEMSNPCSGLPVSQTQLELTMTAHKQPAQSVHNSSSIHMSAGDNASDAMDQDAQLEYHSMVFLSKLEQLVIRLSDITLQRSQPSIIGALTDLINYILEFSENLPISDNRKLTLHALLDRDIQNYSHLHPNYVKNNRLVFDSFSCIVQEIDIFQKICNDYLRIINIYLSICIKSFQSPHISEQWKVLYTGFFVNLTKIIRNNKNI